MRTSQALDVVTNDVCMDGRDESKSEVKCWLVENPKSQASQDIIEISSDSDCDEDGELDVECWLVNKDIGPLRGAQQFIYVDSD